VLAEARERLGEAAKQSPELKDDLDEQEADHNGGDDDGDDEEDGHERVCRRDTVLLHEPLDARHGHADGILGTTLVRRFVDRSIDARLDLPCSKTHKFAHGSLEQALRGCLRGAIGVDQRRVLQKLDTVLRQVASRDAAKVVDRHL
jgi:hypothetical protein